MKLRNLIAALFAGLALSHPAGAATQLVDPNGNLVGATGVMLFDEVFNVSIFDTGSCADFYNGCDSVDDFFVDNAQDATEALFAVGRQVVIDGPLGDFRSDTTLSGCDLRCRYLLPIGFREISGETRVEFATLSIANASSNQASGCCTEFFFTSTRTFNPIDDDFFIVQFNALTDPGGTTGPGVSTVPLPATLPLFLGGLAGFAFLRRARHRS